MLGPNSSRLLKESSIFVETIQVRDDAKKGVLLYGFSEKPELTLETSWNVSNYLIVGSYRRQGFSLWLNKGSRIHLRWGVHSSGFSDLQVVVIKGEQDFETLDPNSTNSSKSLVFSSPTKGNGEAEYIIEEDDSYYVGAVNMNPKSVIMELSTNVLSKMYDTSKAASKCSTINGSCSLELLFPNSHYLILTTPDNGDFDGWYIELSFIARLATYVVILGIILVAILLILKYFGVCEGERTVEQVTDEVRENETSPLLPEKAIPFSYGTGEEEDSESSMHGSSEDLYDGKICVICYDEQRNCFFIPCGHSATCYTCAERIVEGENKVCPICRRLIHKVRRLFIP
ncbi:PREDICTED: uncharacterized protein LOC104611677 isoform X2 [Nelumbo nucifera]|nr:PREDICTED: uncharacterized protein LOC104611677 isoform X2 [Nelumbo nucifera]